MQLCKVHLLQKISCRKLFPRIVMQAQANKTNSKEASTIKGSAGSLMRESEHRDSMKFQSIFRSTTMITFYCNVFQLFSIFKTQFEKLETKRRCSKRKVIALLFLNLALMEKSNFDSTLSIEMSTRDLTELVKTSITALRRMFKNGKKDAVNNLRSFFIARVKKR